MKSRLLLSVLTSIFIGGVIYIVSNTLANNYLDSVYIQYPEMQLLTIGSIVVISLFSALFANSFFQTETDQEPSSIRVLNVFRWIVILGILVSAVIIGRLSIVIITRNTTANWEELVNEPTPYISIDFVKLFEADSIVGCENCDQITSGVITIKGDRQRTLYMHPPSQAAFDVLVPAGARLAFSIALAPASWQIGMGDGVQFSVNVDAGRGVRNIFSAYIDPKNLASDRDWLDYEVNLSEWVGQKISLIFVTSPGPNNDDRYDWAGWGEPRIEPDVYYQFLDHLPDAEAELTNPEFGKANKNTLSINNELRDILYQHPSSRVNYTLTLPPNPIMQFGLGLSEEVWSPDKGDGVEYNIYVRNLTAPNTLYRVYHKTIDPKNNPEDRKWFDQEVDLSKFGGQSVEIIFEALPGPVDNYDFDWGGWSNPVLLDETVAVYEQDGEN